MTRISTIISLLLFHTTRIESITRSDTYDEKMRVLAKNMSIMASEIKFTDQSIIAKNVSINAEEMFLGEFLKGFHLKFLKKFEKPKKKMVVYGDECL